MANDKQKLQEKADALRRDLSELDTQISKMKTEPESVKPIVEGPYRDYLYTDHGVGKHHIRLAFDTPEQAEKAKAILDKMEFGDPPFTEDDAVEFMDRPDEWSHYGDWDDRYTWVDSWRMGHVRMKV